MQNSLGWSSDSESDSESDRNIKDSESSNKYGFDIRDGNLKTLISGPTSYLID